MAMSKVRRLNQFSGFLEPKVSPKISGRRVLEGGNLVLEGGRCFVLELWVRKKSIAW